MRGDGCSAACGWCNACEVGNGMVTRPCRNHHCRKPVRVYNPTNWTDAYCSDACRALLEQEAFQVAMSDPRRA
jgi:hypothetical protein